VVHSNTLSIIGLLASNSRGVHSPRCVPPDQQLGDTTLFGIQPQYLAKHLRL